MAKDISEIPAPYAAPTADAFQGNRRALLWFVGLTFSATWSLWSLFWVFDLRPTDSNPEFGRLAYGASLIPGIAALLVTKRVLLESWRTSTIDCFGTIRFYLWACLLPPLFVFTTVLLSRLFGIAQLNLSDPHRLALVIELTGESPILAICALSEEVGWRGFLLPRLMRIGYGEWMALVATGLVWGAWHAPIVLRGFNYPHHPYAAVPMMVIFCILMGIILGWLRLASGSVWVSGACHTFVNLSIPLGMSLLRDAGDSLVGGRITSVVGWIPLAGFCLWLVWSHRLPTSQRSYARSASSRSI